jgi:hypothetical protein
VILQHYHSATPTPLPPPLSLVFSTKGPNIITHTAAATTPTKKKKKEKTHLASCYQQVGMCQIKENEKIKSVWI